jgi:hypothetical protein
LELKQGQVGEVRGDAAKGGFQAINPHVAITIRQQRSGNVAVDAES